MALSFAEKRKHQNEIAECYAQLDAGPDFKTKRGLQNRVQEIYAILDGASAPARKTLLDRFLAGEFISAMPKDMYKIFIRVFAEAKGALDILKAPIEKFFTYHEKEFVMESAISQCQHFNIDHDRVGKDDLEKLMRLILSGTKGTLTINLQ